MYLLGGVDPGWRGQGAGAGRAPLPAGLRVEPYSPRRWSVAQWVPLAVGSARFVPELSLLALDRDELAGYILSYQDIIRPGSTSARSGCGRGLPAGRLHGRVPLGPLRHDAAALNRLTAAGVIVGREVMQR